MSEVLSMNDVSGIALEESLNGITADRGATAGALIRRAREQAGLHIGALAVSLKVPVKKLEALESDRLDELPDIVFARALAATVCRILKVDSGPILAALPPTVASPSGSVAGATKPAFRNTGHIPQRSIFEKLTRPFMLMGVAFALGALALIVYPSLEPFFTGSSGSSEIGLKSASNVAATDNQSAAQTTLAPEQDGNALAIRQAPVQLGGATVVPAAASQPALTTIEVSSTGAAENSKAMAQPALETQGILTLTSKGNSWVEVVDASRVTQLRKTMAMGESQAVSGAVPLSVTVGRADTIEVQVRGKTIDLASFTKDNVARFEVK